MKYRESLIVIIGFQQFTYEFADVASRLFDPFNSFNLTVNSIL